MQYQVFFNRNLREQLQYFRILEERIFENTTKLVIFDSGVQIVGDFYALSCSLPQAEKRYH